MRAPNPDAARLLGRAYAIILSWPCHACGQPAPCPCDEADNPDWHSDWCASRDGNLCDCGIPYAPKPELKPEPDADA